MARRLALSTSLIALTWAGVLQAQTDDIQSYIERGRELAKAQKYDQALFYYLFALEQSELEFGVGSPRVVPLLNDLAGLYLEQGQYRDAEPLLLRSVAIQERVLADYQAGMVRTLNSLGALYEATDRPGSAVELYERVLRVWEPALGSDNPSIRLARGRLADLTPEVAEPAPEPAPEPSPEPEPVPEVVETPPPTPEPAPEPAPEVAEVPPAEPAPEPEPTPESEIAEAPPEPRAEPPAEPEPAPEPAAAPPPEAAYRIHLTSIRDRADAREEWTRLQRIYPVRLGDLSLSVTRADLGAERGVWYRIHGGPLTEAAARRLCGDFRAEDLWCNPVRMGPETRIAAPAPQPPGRRPTPAAPQPAPEPAREPPEPAEPPQVANRPSPEPGAAASSGYQIHLTSIRRRGDAEAEWQRLNRIYPALLAGLSLTVKRVDLGPEKGIWYRIQAGPLDRAEARRLCAEFAERRHWCDVMPPSGGSAEILEVRLAEQTRTIEAACRRHGGGLTAAFAVATEPACRRFAAEA